MKLADAFAGIKHPEPERLGTQAPGAPGFVSKSTQKGGSGKQQSKPEAAGTLEAGRPALSLQGTAKSKHPDYEAVKVYLRRNTHKQARRKFEDQGEGDFSDLVEMLLQQYLRA